MHESCFMQISVTKEKRDTWLQQVNEKGPIIQGWF